MSALHLTDLLPSQKLFTAVIRSCANVGDRLLSGQSGQSVTHPHDRHSVLRVGVTP